MIPYYTRVAALDDKEDHLQKIVIGLSKAGFCTLPVLYDAGVFVPSLPQKCSGIRLVFTDIHLMQAANGAHIHASNILNGLRNLLEPGPFGLIFWSQFPGDSDDVWAEIVNRAPGMGVSVPLFRGVIDKNEVFNVATNGDFNADVLREKIIEQARASKVLAEAAAWDDRVSSAATKATNRLYELAIKGIAPLGDSAASQSSWTQLLGYLASEAVGKDRAIGFPNYALDNALLPLVEDQLYRENSIRQSSPGTEPHIVAQHLQELPAGSKPAPPANVPKAALNGHYSIEVVESGSTAMSERGTVFEMGDAFINSGPFTAVFEYESNALISDEFLLNGQALNDEERRLIKLCLVELSAKCDFVQNKVAVHRYLLALKAPQSLAAKFVSSRSGPKHAGIKDMGELDLSDTSGSFRLLVSVRRFMSLAPTSRIPGRRLFRLRHDVVEDLAHHYATHARRPGVMRFY